MAAEADEYLREVARRLGGLPDEERAELLDDLAQHLREITAEDSGPLRERIGTPAEYAAELLAAAGVTETPRRRTWPWTRARVAVTRTVERLAATRPGAEFAALVPRLRPAWWVLRAYLAVALVAATGVTGGLLSGRPVPAVLGSRMLGLALIVALIPASVRLGERPHAGTRRRLLLAANAVLVMFALVLFERTGRVEHSYVHVGDPARFEETCLRGGTGDRITNLYAYDVDGRLLDPVLLYDESGRPVDNLCPEYDREGRPLATTYLRDVNGAPVIHAFPRDQTVSPWPGQRVGPPTTGPSTPVNPPAVVVPRLPVPTTTTIGG